MAIPAGILTETSHQIISARRVTLAHDGTFLELDGQTGQHVIEDHIHSVLFPFLL
jgi:hypothetical protein